MLNDIVKVLDMDIVDFELGSDWFKVEMKNGNVEIVRFEGGKCYLGKNVIGRLEKVGDLKGYMFDSFEDLDRFYELVANDMELFEELLEVDYKKMKDGKGLLVIK